MNKRDDSSAVVLQAVGKRFGKRVVLDDLTLTLRSRGVVGVTGANGCGKSTLVSLIAGFARPSSGTVTVLGQPARQAAREGRVAVLSQRVQLRADERVEHFLDYLRGLNGSSRRQLAALLERLELARVAKHRCGELSIGYQRRVALAAALIGEPSVVVLDEPTAGLEPEAIRVVHQLIERLGESASVLVASPDPAELGAICQHVHWLETGRVADVEPNEASISPRSVPTRANDPLRANERRAGEETPR
jgi:ABC-2 type transport system ATP-binding protein